jgi:hypothetical protein
MPDDFTTQVSDHLATLYWATVMLVLGLFATAIWHGQSHVRVLDIKEAFSAEKVDGRHTLPREEDAKSAERWAKTRSTLIEA